jgi:hypothetical protein
MASTAVGNAELKNELILERARNLLALSLLVITPELRGEIELWLEDYWKKYGPKRTNHGDSTII